MVEFQNQNKPKEGRITNEILTKRIKDLERSLNTLHTQLNINMELFDSYDYAKISKSLAIIYGEVEKTRNFMRRE